MLTRFKQHSTSKRKRTLTERLICYMSFIYYPAWTFVVLCFFTYYPNMPVSLTSLLTTEQSKNLLYVLPINLFQLLLLSPLAIFVHGGLYIVLSFIVTVRQNCVDQLENLQRYDKHFLWIRKLPKKIKWGAIQKQIFSLQWGDGGGVRRRTLQ